MNIKRDAIVMTELSPEMTSSAELTLDARRVCDERHRGFKSIAQTFIESVRDGEVIISTVIKGAGHDSSEGFYTMLETFVFGGQFHGMSSSFTTAGSRRNRLKASVIEHIKMVEKLADCYLEDHFE